ncbi:RNA-binding protein [candidate division WOR-1 bacterium RIFOXYB2_FULL_42_35]|uniref:RNA-binding protein n=1 Tax=candidate division WOR-1 bacterium RIFOXYC2_FULL_41_25 TaxID=1802586 RepID=A0A1F4TM44_UNCSA|nr:MAG: RNA-binding protein [candidate division WOR-1 bacterium RIFOXYA2_FULL_41_14]OGC23889.1 MAG: RNA-binding protein [candidate division WOR-1 bacterium RIFOXYB2_FULL_42_35]OGC33764.1 MAG: RNA-binding protein [candidate division WOR-1 bacterium RIFOXYC2_FULL_41_25]OGC44185.1 MAG: RNA-binding protein [candidate division WOR-1 bacterium RIFOXYD2_FULL_41_8]
MKSIFVGNLPWSAKSEDLEAKFSEFGTVSSARVMTDKMTGKSRGFGFVDMDDAGAEKAIAALSDYEWDGRKLTVNEARPRAERSDSRDRGPRRDSYGF